MVRIQEQDLGSYLVVYFKDGNPAYIGKALDTGARRELGDDVLDPSVLWLEPSRSVESLEPRVASSPAWLHPQNVKSLEERGTKTIWSLDEIAGYSVLRISESQE